MKSDNQPYDRGVSCTNEAPVAACAATATAVNKHTGSWTRQCASGAFLRHLRKQQKRSFIKERATAPLPIGHEPITSETCPFSVQARGTTMPARHHFP
jgi:hypothetical protein